MLLSFACQNQWCPIHCPLCRRWNASWAGCRTRLAVPPEPRGARPPVLLAVRPGRRRRQRRAADAQHAGPGAASRFRWPRGGPPPQPHSHRQRESFSSVWLNPTSHWEQG
jgi:hypothetical protein